MPLNVCHYFATNDFKIGKHCRKEHPKICNKFKRAGRAKFKKAGCNNDYEFCHPKACYESMKTKMCKRTNCKFFHLTGTIKDEPTNTPKMENNSVIK